MTYEEIMRKLEKLGSEQTKQNYNKQVADYIGKVQVDVGNTACKVPLATEYIKKIEVNNRVGLKRKTCIC